eukprot:Pgem_evm1s5621
MTTKKKDITKLFNEDKKKEWDLLHNKIPLHEAWFVKVSSKTPCYKAICEIRVSDSDSTSIVDSVPSTSKSGNADNNSSKSTKNTSRRVVHSATSSIFLVRI